jgi:isoleucyl-tRNA synthetase
MRAGLAEREPVRLAHWERNGLYHAVQLRRSQAPVFVLHDGPPFTNGDVHIGTALNKVLKDIVIRFKTLRGFRTPYVPGWDCHGLPIEQKVTQNLDPGATTPRLRSECDKFSESWIALQTTQFKRLGILGDWENPYKTKDPRYEADILRTFADFVEAGMVYRRKKPVYYSIPFGTALAEAEIEYKEHVSPSVWVKFRVSPDSGAKFGLPVDKPLSLVIWTTTPWTLPANLAVALNPDLDYVVVEPLEGGFKDERLLVAEGCYLAFLSRLGLAYPATNPDPSKSARIVHAAKGAALEGLETRHPFIARVSPVVLAGYVTTESGTGCVHIAPGHGTEDYQVGLKYNLPIYCPIDGDGRYADDPDCPELRIPGDLISPLITTLETVEDLKAKKTSSANVAVLRKLAETDSLVAKEKHSHSYPHCWRSKTPIIYCAQYQWFVHLDHGHARKAALAAINGVRWIPDWGGARMRGSVETRPDWCISRNRKWGVPIPAFFQASEGRSFLDADVIRALADKVERHGSNLWYESGAAKILEGIELPRNWPAVSELEPGRDTLDVWLDSGSSHEAVLKREKGGTRWPADLYLEGSDQHRGWFQSSLWTAVVAEGGAPYRAVLTHGFIVDEDRKKISKSSTYQKPQTSDAYVAEYGADVVRLWISSQDFRNDIPISKEILANVGETYRLIRNTFRYQLSNLFDFDPNLHAVPPAEMDPLDRWALHQTSELVRACAAAYEAYEFHRVYQLCNQFCSVTLSATYHDILKDRLYTLGAGNPLRRSSQTAIRHVFEALARVLSPILAFTSDEAWSFGLHRTEFAGVSIHAEDWPAPPADWTDAGIDADMTALLGIRTRVNEAIEPLRAAGRLGKSLDAAITLAAGPAAPDLGALRRHEGLLPELFIVSRVALEADGDASATSISVRPCAELGLERCPRCWRWVPSLEDSPGGRVCPRCIAALNL